jgi:hypothetical protein
VNSSHDVLLNDGQAKRKVSKLVGSWAEGGHGVARPDGVIHRYIIYKHPFRTTPFSPQ